MKLLYVFKERAPIFVEPARRLSLSSASRLLAAPPTFAPCMRQTVDLRIHSGKMSTLKSNVRWVWVSLIIWKL